MQCHIRWIVTWPVTVWYAVVAFAIGTAIRIVHSARETGRDAESHREMRRDTERHREAQTDTESDAEAWGRQTRRRSWALLLMSIFPCPRTVYGRRFCNTPIDTESREETPLGHSELRRVTERHREAPTDTEREREREREMQRHGGGKPEQ